MFYTYKLVTSTIKGEDGILRTVFGIAAYAEGEETPRRIVEDVFACAEDAQRFVIACNVLGLDIDHLDDVIYDVINA